MRRWGLWLFFALTFGITWGLASFYILQPAAAVRTLGPVAFTNPFLFVAVWSPTLSAILVAGLVDGRRGLRDLFGRLLRWRIGWQWYAVAVVGTASLAFAARYLDSYFTGVAPPPIFEVSQYPAWALIGLITLVADPGPLGEDPGWRGFAQPRMLARWRALWVGVTLGLIWGVWHLPAFFIPGMPQATFSIPGFLAGSVGISILMVWVSNITQGSAIPAILIHWSLNRFNDLTGDGTLFAAITFGAAALLVLLFYGMDLGKTRAEQIASLS